MTDVTVVQPGEGDIARLPGFGAVYKLHSQANGGQVAIVEHPFEVGSITRPHLHTREDEHSIVLAGEIGFRSDDTEIVLGPGGYITKPRGQMHAMWNAGTVPGRIIEVITPGGFEDYFMDLSELLLSGKNSGPEFAALAEKYGLVYDTPDWLDDVVRRYGLNGPTH
ncbi:cupin domain-containing protein [Kibdelosporangium philippinense]|uniref:Cupin domain-containing protein n=1 Tax=Kibdelosporangium philippinense TaxID=211113 RepID=A0ABS8Z946_9PSEU|nr:cupin domain-containing protein [Kibdelosporangium philippinense]MCE7004399.1 cupin domain-containing protein [Kibdelosporangium philippinense]